MAIGGAALAQAGTLTRAGTAMARSALLRRADLGHGWTSQPPPARVPKLTCSGFSPSVNGTVQTGAAASPMFAQSSNGPFASSVAYVYATAPQAVKVWRAVVTARLMRCVAQSLVAGSGQGAKFTVDRKQTLSLPSIASQRRGYRVTGTATSTDQQISVYLDVLVLERGRTIAALSFSSFEVPVSRALELRLARQVAGRLQG